jgi:hypothetical protein
MAVTITSNPPANPRPAGQYLIYTLDEATAPDRFIVQVFKSTDTGASGSEVAKLYLVPNAAGVAHFDLSRIAEPLVEFPLSKGGTAVHAVQDASFVFNCDEQGVLRYEVRAGQYNGTTETLNQASEHVYLLRGVEQISAGLNPSFSAYYPQSSTNKAWLTDRPQDSVGEVNMTMSVDDEGVMMFLVPDNMGVTTSVGEVQVRGFRAGGGADGSVDIPIAASTTTKENLKAVPIGPAHWSHLGITSGAVTQVSFQLATTAGLARSEKLWVRLDEAPCNHEATQLAWINSRGGWDYLRFDGRAPYTVSTTSKEYRKSVGTFGEATFTIASDIQQYDTYGKVAKEGYTLTEQFFSAEERDLLQYLMRSPVVQMRRGTGEWEPCIVRTTSLRIEPSGTRFYAVTLDVELARDVRC